MRKVTLDRTDDALFRGESGAVEVDDAADPNSTTRAPLRPTANLNEPGPFGSRLVTRTVTRRLRRRALPGYQPAPSDQGRGERGRGENVQ